MIRILKNMILNFLGIGSRIDSLEKFVIIKDQEIRELRYLVIKQTEVVSSLIASQVHINSILFPDTGGREIYLDDITLESTYRNFLVSIPDDDDFLN